LKNKKIDAGKKNSEHKTKNTFWIKNFRIQKYVPKIEIQNILDKSFKNNFSHFCVRLFSSFRRDIFVIFLELIRCMLKLIRWREKLSIRNMI